MFSLNPYMGTANQMGRKITMQSMSSSFDQDKININLNNSIQAQCGNIDDILSQLFTPDIIKTDIFRTVYRILPSGMKNRYKTKKLVWEPYHKSVIHRNEKTKQTKFLKKPNLYNSLFEEST